MPNLFALMSDGPEYPIAAGATMKGRTGGHESEGGAPSGLVLLPLTGSVVRAMAHGTRLISQPPSPRAPINRRPADLERLDLSTGEAHMAGLVNAQGAFR
jgi:hypothetical protein